MKAGVMLLARTSSKITGMVLRACLLLCLSLRAPAQTSAAPSDLVDRVPLSYELVSIHKSKPGAQGYDLRNTPEILRTA